MDDWTSAISVVSVLVAVGAGLLGVLASGHPLKRIHELNEISRAEHLDTSTRLRLHIISNKWARQYAAVHTSSGWRALRFLARAVQAISIFLIVLGLLFLLRGVSEFAWMVWVGVVGYAAGRILDEFRLTRTGAEPEVSDSAVQGPRQRTE